MRTVAKLGLRVWILYWDAMHFRSVVLVSEALESREGTTECIMFLKKFYSVFTACYLLVWPPRLRGWTETGSKLDFYCNSVCNFAKLALMVELFPRSKAAGSLL